MLFNGYKILQRKKGACLLRGMAVRVRREYSGGAIQVVGPAREFKSMTKIFFVPIPASALSYGASAALAQTAEPAKVADTSKGKALVDVKGMTLYILDRDN